MSLLARLLGPRQSDPDGSIGHRWWLRSAVRRVVGLVAQYQWWLLGVAAVAAFVLGYIGSWRFMTEQHGVVHISDAAYLSIKDFVLENDEHPPLPWQLDLARFLAPIVAGWATISALGLLFRDRVQQLKIAWMHDHVVICGLGEYIGTTFLRHLRDARIPVVVVESKADNPRIELCRSLGAPVVIGDAQRRKTLEQAGAHRARRVLAVTDADAVNTQIVATWRALRGRRSRQQGCLARIVDPDFCSLLRIQEAQREDEPTVDFFNIDEISARLMLKEFPLATDCKQPHILVAHLDPLGVWLVYHAARAWHDKRGDKTDPLMVTVLDDTPEESVQALKSRHPELKNICTFNSFRATAEEIREKLAGHHLNPETPHISRAYVTAYDDHQAFQTALKLHHQLHKLDPTVPVVVALAHTHGVASLLADVKKAGALAHVDVFTTLERACSIELVWGGSFEPLAEEIHERWREQQLRFDKPAPSWEELDESRRESSRAQARAFSVKLHKVHCAMAPLQDWKDANFTFTDEEVEELAPDEHDRWLHERLDAGWTLIPMPDSTDLREVNRLLEEAKSRKQSPYLISWTELLELDAEMNRRFGDKWSSIADLDRDAVQEIPKRLAAVGLQVIRTDTIAPAATNQAVVEQAARA